LLGPKNKPKDPNAEPKPEEMQLEEAMTLAAAEGLKLIRSSRSASGFHRVYLQSNSTRWAAWSWDASSGRERFLSCGSTMYECALAYARWLGPEACRAAAVEADRHMMSAEEAVHCAEAEGLVLRQSDSWSGYVGVKHHKTGRNARPYQAYQKRSLGYYATAQEAALVFARHCRGVDEESRKAAKSGALKEAARKRKEARLAVAHGGEEVPATGTVEAPVQKRPRKRGGAPVQARNLTDSVAACTRPGVGFEIEGVD
tara:strand:- start:193 stop:963 length:771 start_codon:yes stop_codon:yes gene_type:complete